MKLKDIIYSLPSVFIIDDVRVKESFTITPDTKFHIIREMLECKVSVMYCVNNKIVIEIT